MDQSPLVMEQIDSGAELVRRFQRFKPVQTAFWLNPPDDGRWVLYIASPEIDLSRRDIGYGEVVRLVQELRTPYIDPFRVRLVGAEVPLAQAAVEMDRQYPGPWANRVREKYFGDQWVEEVYIYPSQVIAPVG